MDAPVLKPGDQVHVRWVDSCRYDEGWEPASWWAKHLAADDLDHESDGFFVCETEECVAVALSKSSGDADPHMCQVMRIPRCAVSEIRKVTL